MYSFMRNILCQLILFLNITSLLYAEEFSKNIINITATSLSYNYISPWQKKAAESLSLNGVVIKNNLILTVSHKLADHVFIEVSKFGKEKKYAAEVILKDYRCGLALLKVNDETFFNDLSPLEVSGDQYINKKILIPLWENGIIKEYSADFIKSAMEYYQSYGVVLIHHMNSDLNNGGRGEPVIINGKIAGITASYNKDKKVIKVISAEVIERMLTDFADGNYEGVPYFYLEDEAIESDENLRDNLGMNDEDSGVLINKVPPMTSGGDVLKNGDVILGINNIKIDDNGLYESALYGKLNYYGIIYLNHFAGDVINMEIIRNKKKMDVKFKLKPFAEENFLIPSIDYDVKPKYLIIGGVLFQELTRSYLMTWGKEWSVKANKRFMYYLDNFAEYPDEAGKRVVILNTVLPGSVNNGYHQMNNLILKKINDIDVKNLRHLKAVIDRSNDKFIKFDFIGEQSIVLEREKAVDSEKDILLKYNIPSPYYLGDAAP